MTSFHSARIRLTGWYIIISALISITFSIVIFTSVTEEIRQGFITAEQRVRIGPFSARERALLFLQEEYAAATKAVMLRLLIMNTAIVAATGIAGYFLAGKALQPIEEMVEDQKRFVGDASHELRTPLTTLRSEIEVSLREKLPLKTKHILKSNLEEVLKMQDLVSALLSLSKYTDSADLPKEEYDLSEIAKEVIKSFNEEIKRKNIKIKTKLEPAVATVNETTVRQLFSILLDNAIKYNNSKGTVTVSTKSARRHIVIKIADTGPGIPHEDIPLLFNRFYRVDPSRYKGNVEGYGLGLAIAKSLVDLHSGDISVTSEVNKGTTFTVAIPR